MTRRRGEDSLVYGIHPVEEVLAARPEEIETIWISETLRGRGGRNLQDAARRGGVRTQWLSKAEIDRLAPGAVHQGVVAKVAAPVYREMSEVLEGARGEDPLLVALDQVQDPIHLGAVIRSSHLLGGHGVVITKDRAVGLTPAAMKASAGAAARLPVARVTNLSRTLEDLKEAGIWIVGADMEGEPCDEVDLKGPICLVVGGEGKGLRRLTKERCDRLVSIPMAGEGVGSFSASASASILLYEIARQRRRSIGLARGNSPAFPP